MKTGVLLAAGDATRMPNKLMLHTPSAYPLFYNAYEWLKRHCEKVCVVVKPQSDLIKFFRREDLDEPEWVVQERAAGVCNAIDLCQRKDILVAFADCYGYQKLRVPHENSATVIALPIEGLDGWDGRRWVPRGTQYMSHSFLGAFSTDRWQLGHTSLMDALNGLSILPEVVPWPVQDCGTPEGYSRIW